MNTTNEQANATVNHQPVIQSVPPVQAHDVVIPPQNVPEELPPVIDLNEMMMGDTYTHKVKHPRTGLVIDGMTITSKSPHSETWKKRFNELNANRPRNAKFDVVRQGNNQIELITSVVTQWEGFVENGVVLDCTYENVKYVFKKYPWLLVQIDSAIADDANFLTSAETD